MIKGYWIPVLHTHLPFVKHPQYENFLEEFWLFEAISECYIPLLQRLKRLEDEGVSFSLTVSYVYPFLSVFSSFDFYK